MTRVGLMPKKLVVPQPVAAFTTRKTLVMDFLEGTTFEKLSRRCLDQMAAAKGQKKRQLQDSGGLKGAIEADKEEEEGKSTTEKLSLIHI